MDKAEHQRRTQPCTICLERHPDCSLDSCPHRFCVPCIKHWSKKHNTCPLCRTTYHVLKTQNKIIRVIKPKRSEMPLRLRSALNGRHSEERRESLSSVFLPQPQTQLFTPVYLIPVMIVPYQFSGSSLGLNVSQGLQEVSSTSL